MIIDIKTTLAVLTILAMIIAGSMGYGSLKTEVKTLKIDMSDKNASDNKIESDISSIKMNVATLLERTKPHK